MLHGFTCVILGHLCPISWVNKDIAREPIYSALLLMHEIRILVFQSLPQQCVFSNSRRVFTRWFHSSHLLAQQGWQMMGLARQSAASELGPSWHLQTAERKTLATSSGPYSYTEIDSRHPPSHRSYQQYVYYQCSLTRALGTHLLIAGRLDVWCFVNGLTPAK